ncbi:hypothetical protein G4Y79_16870 [Phototrophicus methaneseepsis]|uniref:Uncharacterized protein n=1 Tax=Phototrophicus methaneseepsis TaxID=2710758 RepID=A0A7S8ICB3_9CHLR|nr:hypothetical protein [Phototrophicus methaneseepsis]QPC81360.1 hypothetical protein G4Y79_16870 [Phototrophicus methaneseepsis]
MLKNIFIAVVAIVVTGGVLTYVLAQQLTDTARINRVAHSIANFDLPAGYQADYAVEILDYTIAAYQSADGHGHLALLQAPANVIPNEQVMQGYVANNDQQTMTWSSSTLVGSEQHLVRGQPATAMITDRINSEGETYRSLNMVFEGENGTILLVINQPLTQWDDASIEAFIASIR